MRSFRRRTAVVAATVSMIWLASTPGLAAPGDVDSSFADLGLLSQAQAITYGTPMVAGPGGRFVIAWGTANDVAVSGFFGGGGSDGGYGTGGSSSIPITGATEVDALDATVDGSDRVIVTGYATVASDDAMFVARFTATGAPDTSFSGDGVRTFSFPQPESYGYRVVVRGGKIYVAGQVYDSGVGDPLVIRLNPNGTLDQAFGNGGTKRYVVDDGYAGDDWFEGIVPVSHGRFVLAGKVGTSQYAKTLVMRIHADGRLDRSFRGDGTFTMSVLEANDYAIDLVKDGSKLVLGISGTQMKPSILRLRGDGSRDPSFGTNGLGRYPMEGFFYMTNIAVDAHHRVLAVGYNNEMPVFRVRSDGRLATGFGTDGVATNPDAIGGISGYDVMLQGDLILVSGFDAPTSINATRYLS